MSYTNCLGQLSLFDTPPVVGGRVCYLPVGI